MPRIKVKVKDIDKGFKQLAAQLGGMGSVSLGIHEAQAKEAHPDSELTVGQIGAIHEFGLGVPARPFVRTWIDTNANKLVQEAANQYRLVAKGGISRKAALENLGYAWTDRLRKWVRAGNVRPTLSASTIKSKGSSIPLVDSGKMINSVQYRVYLPMLKSMSADEQRIVRRYK